MSQRVKNQNSSKKNIFFFNYVNIHTLYISFFLFLGSINKMETTEKKKKRCGKKSFERFKAKCKLLREEKQKKKKLEKRLRDEQKSILAEKKKQKYNRMIARLHEEIERKERM